MPFSLRFSVLLSFWNWVDIGKPLHQNCCQNQYTSIKYFRSLESCWKTRTFQSSEWGTMALVSPKRSLHTSLGNLSKNYWRLLSVLQSVTSLAQHSSLALSCLALKWSVTFIVIFLEGYTPLVPHAVDVGLMFRAQLGAGGFNHGIPSFQAFHDSNG